MLAMLVLLALFAIVFRLACAGGASSGAATCSLRWQFIASVPKVPVLAFVAALSHDDVWAVGYSEPHNGMSSRT